MDAIAARFGAAFDPATIANARDFLALVRDSCPVPEIANGYWNSFRFMWGTTHEFEVFGDHVEIYLFYNQRTDIQHHARKPGEPFSQEVIAALPGPAG